MKQVLLVFLGGGFGSVARYLVSKYIPSGGHSIPYGTFTANILGSLLIGFILGWAAKNETLTQNQLLLIATGFCGGFTTFSTFAFENYIFLKNGDITSFILYTTLSFAVGLAAVFTGVWLVKFV
jgi:CrcB protein